MLFYESVYCGIVQRNDRQSFDFGCIIHLENLRHHSLPPFFCPFFIRERGESGLNIAQEFFVPLGLVNFSHWGVFTFVVERRVCGADGRTSE